MDLSEDKAGGKHMPSVASVMAELKRKGDEKTRKIYSRHWMREDLIWRTKRVIGVFRIPKLRAGPSVLPPPEHATL
jgi:hypothetical protein